MGALDRLKWFFAGVGAAAPGGCLISDEPFGSAPKPTEYSVCE